MSDAEKYEIQGRAHAALKDAKATAATITASLMAYVQRLDETSAFLKRFLSDPLLDDLAIPRSEVAKQDYRNLHSSTFESNVDELVEKLKSARDLQAQITKF